MSLKEQEMQQLGRSFSLPLMQVFYFMFTYSRYFIFWTQISLVLYPTISNSRKMLTALYCTLFVLPLY
jgi:hypothetical protein